MIDKASLGGEKIVTERVNSLHEIVSPHQPKQWTVGPKEPHREFPVRAKRQVRVCADKVTLNKNFFVTSFITLPTSGLSYVQAASLAHRPET